MPYLRLLGFAVLLLFFGVLACAQSPALLMADSELPAPVGTAITFWIVPPESGGPYHYRFSVKGPGEEFRVVRDFSRLNELKWTALDEGVYEIQVAVRDSATGDAALVTGEFRMSSRLTSSDAVVSETQHPLVFLYSAPPCPEGESIRVEFHPAAGGASTFTPARACLPEGSMNFWLAGLKKDTDYIARHIIGNDPGPDEVAFRTGGEIPLEFFPQTPVQGPSREPAYPYVIHSALAERPSATDLDGNLVWYYPELLTSLTRVDGGGRMWGFLQDLSGPPENQVLREFDVAGFTLRETDAARVNEQLKARGLRPITGFHHEVGSLPGGRIVALASSEQILTDVQGPGEVDVLGDTILVLDSNLQVEWVWDSFDHLDVRRMSTLPHVCNGPSGGCPAYSLMPKANDWTHGNAVTLAPDGNLLFSMRHMDWLIKIDYANGEGGGEVLWRLGNEGDFTPISDDPNPWFSHQHDGVILEDGRLLVFDNGNFRWDSDKSARSRGQVWRLDEEHRTAKLEYNADLGGYASALGSAQALDHGYHFGVGVVGGRRAIATETDASGKITYTIANPSIVYRSYRLKDLYTKP